MKNKLFAAIAAITLLCATATANEPEYDFQKLLEQYDSLKAGQQPALVQQEKEEKQLLLEQIELLQKSNADLKQKLDECVSK